jgi:hypothetical protein
MADDPESENKSDSNPLTSRTLRSFAKAPKPTTAALDVGGLLGVSPRADVADLNSEFKTKIAQLQAAAKAAGVNTTIVSGYRSPELQAKLYSNYKARQAGQPLPYPSEGTGGIAAQPGMSFHNAGMAVDMYAGDHTGQQWLIENAPKYGIYPGSNFGDPGHFQLATDRNTMQQSVANIRPRGDQGAPGGAETSTQSSSSSTFSPSEGAEGLFRGINTLATLQALFPQHQFTPVDYDPFTVEPKVTS